MPPWWYLIPSLACPAAMGLMMWVMMRGQPRRRAANSAFSDTRPLEPVTDDDGAQSPRTSRRQR